jgi:hypothetical protein
VTLPQHVQFGKGGTIYIDVGVAVNAATVSLRSGDGTVKFSDQVATPSTINTTITGAIAAGATSLNVAANTGIEVGSEINLLDDPESVIVSRISTLAVALRRPVKYAHISGATAQSPRINYTVNSAIANTLFWDGWAEWNIDGELDQTAVEITRYPMTRRATAQDMYDLEPLLYDVLDSEQDIERLLDLAHKYVLGELSKMSQDSRARVIPASSSFKTATCLAALFIHYRRRAGEEAKELADRYSEYMKRELDSITNSNPRDADQDQDVQADEKISARTIRLIK